MPELLIDFITSLDGYGAADGWPGWWGLEGPEYLAWLGDQPEADYTVLMGANTYWVSVLGADGAPQPLHASLLDQVAQQPCSRLAQPGVAGAAVDAGNAPVTQLPERSSDRPGSTLGRQGTTAQAGG